ncbi:MAG: flippase-like domain-containing protein [Thermoleophilia bacterium]|nr:flippase-like domain-containing protein [Thermoleophilia bacterium]
MRESLDAFLSAVEVFGERIADVRLLPLLLGIALHLLNSALRTVAWRNIIAAAYPATRVRWRHVFGAYMAGTAANTIMPARAGDPLKLFLLHGRVAGSTYPTLAATLLVESIVDFLLASAMLLWAWQTGLLPLPDLPSLPTFEIGWIVGHPWVLGLVAAVAAAAILWSGTHIRNFWARVQLGFAILRQPWRYLWSVALVQVGSWIARVGGGWAFLEAFHVPGSLKVAILVQVVSSVATSLPATPGGVGPKQALLVIVLAGEAARSNLLAFSVGMDVAVIAVNLIVGGACLVLMRGSLRLRPGAGQRAADPEVPPTPG